MSGLRSLAFPLALALCCAHSPEPPMTAVTPQKAFEGLAQDYLERFLVLSPTDATLLGDHRYDGKWPDVSKDGDAQMQRFEEEILGRLRAIPREGLSLEARVDAEMLEASLRFGAFNRAE